MTPDDSNANFGKKKAPMTESEMLATRLQMIRDFMSKQQGASAMPGPVPPDVPFTAPWLQPPPPLTPPALEKIAPAITQQPQPAPQLSPFSETPQPLGAPPPKVEYELPPAIDTTAPEPLPSAVPPAIEIAPVAAPLDIEPLPSAPVDLELTDPEPALAAPEPPQETPEFPAETIDAAPLATMVGNIIVPELSPAPDLTTPTTDLPPTAKPETAGPRRKTAKSSTSKPVKKPAEVVLEPTSNVRPETIAEAAASTDSADPHKMPNPLALGQAIFNLMEKSQPMMREFMERVKLKPMEPMPGASPFNVGGSLVQLTTQMLANPQRLVDAQLGLWQDYLKLWQNTTRRFLGQTYETVIQPQGSDRRFNDESWSQNTLFDFIKQSYLLTAQWMQREVRDVDGIDADTMRKVEFYTRQFIDAVAPSNFLFTNPEVLRLTAETGGENLVKGLQNLLQDLERGQGQLKISMTDYKAFELGKNIATTPGKVVFQNDMMQLIQYEPLTETAHAAPLLIIPPWINKYYILDLREKNSYVRYCLEQGHTVFMISWVNPDQRHAKKDFGSYMLEGPLAALEEIKRRTGAANANVVGYCLGGTLFACLLAWLNLRPERAKDIPHIASVTYLVTMIDFSDPGELGLFIDDAYLSQLEIQMQEKGYLDAATMATTFNMLRANDLIWSFVVNNYLMGREPFPFDLLYWNADATHMPAAMHSFYLRKMYRENKLIEPNGIELAGEPINLAKIKTPSFMLSTREDHIAPWKSTYAATQIYSGPITFVLSGSGHIAGVINPPAANKYGYWTNESLPPRADAWLEGATQHPGSWWTAWSEWIKQYQGTDIPARKPEAPIIEDAPGGFVRVRAV